MNYSEKPLICIIIPCYNAEKFIHPCLESVLEQTYEHWECFIINDGSNDNTLHILEEYAIKDSRFKVFSQENKGLSATRNLGIENAIGSYIFFLDSDDLLIKNSLLTLVNELDNENDIITGITVTFNGENTERISQLKHPKEGAIFYKNEMQEVLIRTMESGLAPVAQNRLYKSQFLEKYNLKFRNGILHEDELWFFETMYFAKNVKFINEETYLYRTDNSDSITKNVNSKNLNSYLEILETVYSRYYSSNPDIYKKAVVKRYLNYLKKLIIDFFIREKSKLDDNSQLILQEIMKKVHTDFDNKTILSKKNEDYYDALNKLSQFPYKTIERYFFKNPMNSIRKHYKLLQIKYLLK